MKRQAHVIDRAGRAREVEDHIDVLLGEERLRQVVVHEGELLAAKVCDVLQRASVEVVHADHAIPLGKEMVAEVRSDEASGTPVTTAVATT